MTDAAQAPYLSLRVARAELVANDIKLFDLVSPDGADLPEFSPGAHVSVVTPSGLVRKYSLCNDPQERAHYQIAVKREAPGRGGSISMVDDLADGATLSVSRPDNAFALAPQARSYIFIAGGIGITPILSMIRHLISVGGKTFKLYYLARSPATTAFRDELSGAQFRGKVVMHHDDGDPQQAFDLWPVFQRAQPAHVYCCGPRPLMEAVKDMTGHWSTSNIHFEDFGASALPRPDDTAFTVKLAKSGDVFAIPVGSSILDILRAHGRQVASSCESGTCGTCKTRFLSGDVDHRDLALADWERPDHVMICVSRARTGELVLDL